MNNNPLKEVIQWLEEEIHSLEGEINVRNETLNSLKHLIDQLNSFEDSSDYKVRCEQLEHELETEKQRLVKLHDHYRKIESEYSQIKAELQGWQNWFYKNKEIYDRLFTAAPIDTYEPVERQSFEPLKPRPIKTKNEPVKTKKKKRIKRKKKE